MRILLVEDDLNLGQALLKLLRGQFTSASRWNLRWPR